MNIPFLCLAAILLLIDTSGFACDCKPPGPLSSEVPKYEAIFTGEVIEQHSDHQVAKVQEAFKGVEKGALLEITYEKNALCDLALEKGKRYLLFLNHDTNLESTKPGRWRASLCTPGGSLTHSKKTIAEIKKLLRKKSSAGPE